MYTVEQENITLKLYEKQNSLLDEKVLKMAEEKVKENILKAFDFAKEHNVDIFELGDHLYKNCPKKWREFIQKVGMEEYVKHLNIEVEVKFNKQS